MIPSPKKRGDTLPSFPDSLSSRASALFLPLVRRARLFKYAARRNRAHDWHIKSLSPCAGRATRVFLHPRIQSRTNCGSGDDGALGRSPRSFEFCKISRVFPIKLYIIHIGLCIICTYRGMHNLYISLYIYKSIIV